MEKIQKQESKEVARKDFNEVRERASRKGFIEG